MKTSQHRDMIVRTMALLLCMAAVAAAQNVPIVIDAYLPDARPGAPVTFGVPFARGELSTDNFADVRIIDDTGAVVPHQQAITATWDPTGREGVRWLLVDMCVDADRSYRLVRDDAKPQAALRNIATIDGDVIRITHDLYAGTVKTKGFDLFGDLTFRSEPVAHHGDGVFSTFYVEHETRGVFRSDLDPNAIVTLEETGPIRATLKADGWYTNAAGEQFCRYSIRVHFHRGRPEVRIEHTFIFTGLSAEDRIAALGMKVQRQSPTDTRWWRTYVGDDNLLSAQPVSSTSYVVQRASERDRLDFYTPTEDGKVMKHADRGGGWMAGEGGALFFVMIRDAWQQYPWAIRYDAGALDVQLWPQEAGPMDLSWDGYWSHLTERQKHYMSDTMARRMDVTVEKWMDMLRGACNATGAAKTHELWFSPLGGSHLAREAAYPTIAHADSAYMCSTLALDHVPHVSADDGRFADEEIAFRQMLTMMRQAIAANHWHGWWDWGGYHQHLNPDGMNTPRFGLWADDAGMERWHRARPKSHYQWGRFPWLQFMRTGDRDWLRYAQTFTLYSADRAHSHHDGHGRADGSEFHYDNSVVPWMGGYHKYPGGDTLWSPLQSKDDYVYAYWLTGSRRALDVLKANGERILETDDPVRFKPGFERGNDIRNAGMMLERITMLYQATWDERYRALADRIAALFLPLDTVEKVRQAEWDEVSRAYFHQASTWAYQGMWFYDRVTNDPAFRDVLMAFIDRSRDVTAGFTHSLPGGQNGSPRAMTYGYLLTGDTQYLDFARPVVDAFVERGVSRAQFSPGGKQELSGLPALLGAMTNPPQTWRDANLPLRDRGAVFTWRPFQRGTDAYFPATRAFVRDRNDEPWHFILASNGGGTFELYRPDGSVAQTVTFDTPTRNWQRIDVPTDGQRGDYALACTAIDETHPARLERLARILDCNLPVVIEIGLPGRDLGVTGRAYWFAPQPDADAPRVSVIPLDPQRYITLTDAAGNMVASTQGRVPYLNDSMQLAVPQPVRDALLGMRFSLDPADCYKFFERSRLWRFDGIHPYLAANADDYFIPDIPDSLPPLRPAQ